VWGGGGRQPPTRRVTRIELTDEGRATLGELRGARRSAAEEILAPLTEKERRVLGVLLDTLIDGDVAQRC
ncbi:hypothetical protein ACWDE9_45090, partial [Streptomyces olivaceoviridis]